MSARYRNYKRVNIEGGSHPNRIANAESMLAVDLPRRNEDPTKTEPAVLSHPNKNSFSSRRSALSLVVPLLFFSLAYSLNAKGQASSTGGEFWPLVNANTELRSNTRLLLYAGSDKGEDFFHEEVKAGGLLYFRAKPILKKDWLDLDKNKQHHLVFGAGYQYAETIQSGPPSHENRGIVELTGQHRPGGRFFVADRNRVEFRWIKGKYSTRYRNQLTVERNFKTPVRFSPYAEGELFYNGQDHSWDENR